MEGVSARWLCRRTRVHRVADDNFLFVRADEPVRRLGAPAARATLSRYKPLANVAKRARRLFDGHPTSKNPRPHQHHSLQRLAAYATSLKRRNDMIFRLLTGCTIILASGLLSASTAHAQLTDGTFTMKGFVEACAFDRQPPKEACVAYITGVESVMLLNGIASAHVAPGDSMSAAYLTRNGVCPRSASISEPTATEMVHAIIDWMPKHREQWGYPVVNGVLSALSSTWPCHSQ
jgi:hypothetical protein